MPQCVNVTQCAAPNWFSFGSKRKWTSLANNYSKVNKQIEYKTNRVCCKQNAADPFSIISAIHRISLFLTTTRRTQSTGITRNASPAVTASSLGRSGTVRNRLPPKYKKPGTSTYVQGVEAAVDYAGIVPDGFDVMHLPEAEYLMFQGEPFREEDYCEAIRAVQCAMNRYDPSVIGYCWDDENPRIQLEPRGQRGYIELRAVRRVQK